MIGPMPNHEHEVGARAMTNSILRRIYRSAQRNKRRKWRKLRKDIGTKRKPRDIQPFPLEVYFDFDRKQ